MQHRSGALLLFSFFIFYLMLFTDYNLQWNKRVSDRIEKIFPTADDISTWLYSCHTQITTHTYTIPHVLDDILLFFGVISFISLLSSLNRSGELRTQKLKSHLVRTQSLNVLALKPGLGQYIAIHATLTARDFFLTYFYPSSPFTCIFSKPLPIFSCVGCG